MSLVRVQPGDGSPHYYQETVPASPSMDDQPSPELKPVARNDPFSEIFIVEYRIGSRTVSVPTLGTCDPPPLTIFGLLAQFLCFGIVLTVLNWPLAFLLCQSFTLASDGSVHYRRPWYLLTYPFLVLSAITIPWVVFGQSYGFGLRSGGRVSRMCSVFNGVCILAVFAVTMYVTFTGKGAFVSDFVTQGPLAILMVVTGVFFAKKNCCSAWRGILLFSVPMLFVLVISFVYDVWVVLVFVKAGPSGRLFVRTVLHPLLFLVPIYVMRVANIRWQHEHPRTRVAIIAFTTAIKLFWGRLFSSNLETLATVTISSLVVGFGDIAWRLSWPLRLRLLRRTRLGGPSPQRLELAIHYLLFERVLELTLILHTLGLFIAHRITFTASPVDLGFAAKAMAIQLVIQLISDCVCLAMETRVLRWPVAQEWLCVRLKLFPFTAYYFVFLTCVLWERGILLLFEKTFSDLSKYS
eukprot:TRINITY_DN6999_c0_g1_i1.p1 TRINITY_DN6999_c0_g1~~TRINITY_DN6999_c0_g1_i1.p1  ORF type:complete len:465 (+),score=58.95 TRINITY_DN6999_c0_g1_i1:62-1456(+)